MAAHLAQLAVVHAQIAGRVTDVVAEAVEQPLQVAHRVRGGRGVVRGLARGRPVLGRSGLRGVRLRRPVPARRLRGARPGTGPLPAGASHAAAELAQLAGQFRQALAYPGLPVAAVRVRLDLLLDLPDDLLDL